MAFVNRSVLQLVDHYKILGLPPSATQSEIKKAYRQLAQQYHPDKTGNDNYARIQFAAIKEAYETLTDRGRRHEYLQQRWYAKSTGRFEEKQILSPVSMLQDLLKLERYVAHADPHRLDQGSLHDELAAILSNDAIDILNSVNDIAINERIIALALSCCHPLPVQLQHPLLKKLERIQAPDISIDQINQFARTSRRNAAWEKRQWWLVLLAVLLICLLIWYFSP